MTTDSLLTITDLHVSFKNQLGLHPVLCGVNLTVNKGEILALVGESGCGKSVTAQAILGLLGHSGQITQGQIYFEESPLDPANNKQMKCIRGKKIGMIFQDPMTALNPTLSVGWQIAEMLIQHESVSKSAARLGAIELLLRVGIGEATKRYDAYPFEMSGGMKQRVMIAMALACGPSLLIADEPTTALDVTIQAQILNLLKDIQQSTGMGLLLITHNLAIVASLCNRAAVMLKGKIVETNQVDLLFKEPQHDYTAALLENSYR